MLMKLEDLDFGVWGEPILISPEPIDEFVEKFGVVDFRDKEDIVDDFLIYTTFLDPEDADDEEIASRAYDMFDALEEKFGDPAGAVLIVEDREGKFPERFFPVLRSVGELYEAEVLRLERYRDGDGELSLWVTEEAPSDDNIGIGMHVEHHPDRFESFCARQMARLNRVEFEE